MEPIILESMKEVYSTAQDMAKRGFVAGTSGNCSARVPGTDVVVITPTSVEYELMLFEDMCVVNLKGEEVASRYMPSIEINMHLGIYRAREDIGGIVHTHQPMGTAVGISSSGIPPILDEQMARIMGGIDVADYAFPGTKELAENAVRALGDKNACLLPHHGVVATDKKVRDALLNAEIVERAATVFIMSKVLGGPRTIPISPEEFRKAVPNA